MNRAAWLTQPMSKPLVVREAPFPSPTEDEIVVRNVCVAVNPVDSKLQQWDFMSLNYPVILGLEVAGEIVAVGPQAKGFQIGERVIGFVLLESQTPCEIGIAIEAYLRIISYLSRFCHWYVTRNSRNAAFQEYTVLSSVFATRIPNGMALASAVVLPVGICTAATALFTQDNLALPLSIEGLLDASKRDAGTSTTSLSTSAILIWGGSSSVGCAAIQLARAAGLHVITTASTPNWELCKSLGAHEVFDRGSESVVDDIVAALQGRSLVGALNAIGTASTLQACVDILVKTESRKFVANTIPVEDTVELKGVEVNNCMLNPCPSTLSLISSEPHALTILGNILTGSFLYSVHAYQLLQRGLASTIWNEFLPQALEKGLVIPKPDPVVVGNSLEDIQKALDASIKGYSASKLIVMLREVPA